MSEPIANTCECLIAESYKQGFIDGITAYAWHKDGKQWVGTTGTTRLEAISYVTETWNYRPPTSAENCKRMEALVETATEKIRHALTESVKLQSHYAELLNMHDGGKRMTFTAESWIERMGK